MSRFGDRQKPVDAAAGDTEILGDLGRVETLTLEVEDLLRLQRWRPSLVAALRLSPRNAFRPALAYQVALELGEDPEHVEECLSGRVARVDVLLDGEETYASLLQLTNDALKIFDAASQPIDAGDNQGVAGAHNKQRHLKLAPASDAGSGGVLAADELTPGTA